MSTFGLTSDGFFIKRLSDVKSDLEAKFSAEFGNINVDPDSPAGQIIGIFSEAIADVWANMEKVYQAMYPNFADGFSLDNAVAFNGISRLDATSSTCPVLLIGSEGTVVYADRQVEENINSELFKTKTDITIGIGNIVRLKMSVGTVVVGHTYMLSIESVPYSYTAQTGDTDEIIAGELVSKITANQPPETEQVTATDLGGGLFQILVDDKETNVAVILDALIDSEEIGSSVLVESMNTGPITAPISTIDTIVTPVTGLDNVENIVAATIGRNVESDLELRVRRRSSLSKLGNASVPAMKAKMLDEVDGVMSVTINENETEIDYRPSGLAPHSIEFVVSGGTNQDVANKIWEMKAGGIQTQGNSSKVITDSENQQHTIYFTRPLDVYGYVSVVLTKITDGTESFPSDGIQAVIDAIEEFGNQYLIGEDILVQRFLPAIFSVEGVKSAIVTVDMQANWSSSYVPTYGTADIAIDSDKRVVWNQDIAKQIIVTAP